MTISSFEEARLAVASGETVADVARAFVTGLTRQERLWCLDGDAPTWSRIHDRTRRLPQGRFRGRPT
jgi:hypothetical protein